VIYDIKLVVVIRKITVNETADFSCRLAFLLLTVADRR
jgi:hypothetical protein